MAGKAGTFAKEKIEGADFSAFVPKEVGHLANPQTALLEPDSGNIASIPDSIHLRTVCNPQ